MTSTKFTSADATHLLDCKHCIGLACKYYDMPCLVLKKMPDGRLKILVFGERHWKDHPEKQSVRYVPAWRVSRGKS